MTTPPFTGSKQIELKLEDAIPLIDKKFLYQRLWQFPKSHIDENPGKTEQILERQIILAKKENLIIPKISYGYFPCKKSGNAIIIDDGRDGVRFEFPRETTSPHFCLADLFDDFVCLALVTVGNEVITKGTKLFADGKFSQMFYLKGLAAASAEATIEYAHSMIKKEMNNKESKRYSPGYSTCPDLSYQKKIIQLLRGDKIGVSVSKTFQLIPEFSVSAFVTFK